MPDLVQRDGHHQTDEEDDDPREKEPVHLRALQAAGGVLTAPG
jgi:hypothetical protein